MQFRRRLSWLVAFLLSIVLAVHPWTSQATESAELLLQQSQQHYDAGQLSEAKTLLQNIQRQSQDKLIVAIALSNLALIESDQGHWAAANQAIQDSLQILRSLDKASNKPIVEAQVLNVQGRLHLAQGKAESALASWQQAEKLYAQANHINGQIQSQLRQAQALKTLGLYGRTAQEILIPLWQRLDQLPDSQVKAWGLRSFGEVFSVVGIPAIDSKLPQPPSAQAAIEQSLAIAKRLNSPQEIAASQLSLANLLYARIRETGSPSSLSPREQEKLQQDINIAIALYQEVAATSSPNRLSATLNHLMLLLDSDRVTTAAQLATTLQPDILNLPVNRSSMIAKLNFANSLLRLQKRSGTSHDNALEQLLITIIQQIKSLNEPRLLANALGLLGRAQEQTQQYDKAQTTTEQAVLVAKAANDPAQFYRWSVQFGRLQERQNDRQGAIQSYSQAVNTLRNLRSDLRGVDSEALLVEQDALEPVHRQLVDLLLPNDGTQPDSTTLKRTREIIESLQLEEINNYLRTDCLQSSIEIDKIQVPQITAIVYPIILPDRIAILLSVIGQDPKLYNQSISQTEIETTIKQLQEDLRNQISLQYQEPAQQLYNWLIQPIEPELQQQKVETIVFVSDGALRTIPMAALYDGEKFLIEKYSLATTPGLKLTNPRPLQAQTLSSVAFGLTEEKTFDRPDGSSASFSELPYVEPELAGLQQEIQPSTVQLNEQFTRSQFEQTLQNSQAPIVHLATHGEFSSNREQTFLVASDGLININELADALKAGDIARGTPIELLVLSACETAIGDDRAPLGLAGIALKSGARSTVASLWQVNDTATSQLMQQFYKEVATRQVTKAVALQQAQRSILEDPQFRRHPFFWAPFILVGNWL